MTRALAAALLRPLARLLGGVPAWVERWVDVGGRWANDTAGKWER